MMVKSKLSKNRIVFQFWNIEFTYHSNAMGNAIKFSVELTVMLFQKFVPLSNCCRKTEKQSEGQIFSWQNCRSLLK